MNIPATRIERFFRMLARSVIRLACWLTRSPPDDWWTYHHKHCGTKYRGCHPTLCAKDQYEKTGKWRFEIPEEN